MTNARSLKTVNNRVNKLIQFSNIANICRSQIVACTETCLNDSVSNAEILDNSYYVIYIRDRSTGGTRGGGLLAVSNKLSSSLVCTDQC